MGRKVAVVTGGTGGIGSAICRRLDKAGYQVVACYFKDGNHTQARRWQAAQRAAGFDIEILYANVSKFSDCENFAQILLEWFGRVDVLVNNAGITSDSSFKKMSFEQWQQTLDANLTSVFNMTRTLLLPMLDKSYGRIINISSVNGRKGQFGQCNYAATKSALFGFSKSLALEVAKNGITVNTISPGYIETPMLAKMSPDILKSIIGNISVGRLGQPEEVAEAVAFLASDEAGFITGANLDINGGQYM
ncbi:acetoacetyl-CoA reductase [Legionella saoudiensis]|uniref:acetoacetyl-CoA reductase n=1 Tax=Legionella saoudiensis TaxID=1750561 RepID=UPI000731B1A1|nr:acetoacetyl-CoA reductase [Legionella saoudiensis]